MFLFFLYNDPATSVIYTLSLHDALPICGRTIQRRHPTASNIRRTPFACSSTADRKSTRLNSSHSQISYAVFSLKKKKQNQTTNQKLPNSHPATYLHDELYKLYPVHQKQH